MIKSNSSYKKTIQRINQQNEYIKSERQRFKEIGLTPEQVETALQPLISFRDQMLEDVSEFERINSGELDRVTDIRGIGKVLIAGRIYRGMSQGELASILGVSTPQISRDEKNEYYGAGVEKVANVLDALDIEVSIKVSYKKQIRSE